MTPSVSVSVDLKLGGGLPSVGGHEATAGGRDGGQKWSDTKLNGGKINKLYCCCCFLLLKGVPLVCLILVTPLHLLVTCYFLDHNTKYKSTNKLKHIIIGLAAQEYVK